MIERTFLGVGIVLGVVLAGCEPASTPTLESASSAVEETVAAVASPGPTPTATGEVVARFAGRVMTEDDLVAELQRLPSRTRRMMDENGRALFIENYILNDLLYEEGVRQQIDQDPLIRRQIAEMNRRLVVQMLVKKLQEVSAPTEVEIEAFYENNRKLYSTATMRARHILVREEALAKDLRRKLEEDPDSFADLAKEHSIDTASARKGGDLGFFGRGRMVPEFEAAAFVLHEPGETSDVVKTQYGYHIIRLEEWRPGEEKPLDQVRGQIKSKLRQEAVQRRTQDLYEELREKADIQIDSEAVERIAASIPEPPPGTESVPFHGGSH